jgi:hypothetical protein
VKIVVHAHRECEEAPHFEAELGRTGRVIRDIPTAQAPSHPFLVVLDRPHASLSRRGQSVVITARHYAADELEPILS